MAITETSGADAAYEVDPYADIRHALRPEHAELPARELAILIGRQPSLVTLHRMLSSSGPAEASLAVLLGRAGRRRVRLNGSDVPVSAYLRALSHLCREAAEESEVEAPSQEWDVPHGGKTPKPPVIDPFPASPPPLGFDTGNATMNSMMAALAGDAAVSGLCAGLVDLTGNPTNPPYAGLNDQDMVFIGSMQKIAAAYAAFELRARVRAQVASEIAGGLSTPAKGWEKPVLASLAAAWRPKLAFHRLPTGFPGLETIFSFSASGDVDFAAASPPLSQVQLDSVGEFGRIEVAEAHRPAGRYADALRSMLRWSNNASASLCIRPLSFPYINGLLAAAGFFDAKQQRGMWLSADYADHDWIPNPPHQPQANRAGHALTARWQGLQHRKLSNITATAFQLARFMTLLAQDKLLSEPGANQEFRDPMTRPGGLVSFIADALAHDGRPVASLVAKIGVGDDNSGHDCGIVERVVGGKPLRYVVVGLGDLDPANAGLQRLFPRLDDIIIALHP